MKNFSVVFFFVVCFVVFPGVSFSQKTTYNGWAEEEAVFSKALAIRAKELEKKSGFRFDKDSTPKAEFEWRLGNRISNPIAAEYWPETKSIHFAAFLISETNVKYKLPVRLIDPAVLSGDKGLGELFDHELGHMLMDQVSRRNKLGPWFTVEHFHTLNHEEQLGLNILSEGVAMYFQRVRYPAQEKISEAAFPATPEQWGYTFDVVAFQGGHWLVRDILKEHGERGLIWLIAHPFVAKDSNMREAAVSYRSQALAGLKKDLHKKCGNTQGK